MLGPNGVGKSTIFNLITGLVKPRSGRIKFKSRYNGLSNIFKDKNLKLDMFLNMEDILVNLHLR